MSAKNTKKKEVKSQGWFYDKQGNVKFVNYISSNVYTGQLPTNVGFSMKG